MSRFDMSSELGAHLRNEVRTIKAGVCTIMPLFGTLLSKNNAFDDKNN